jgi:hypothetical protein
VTYTTHGHHIPFTFLDDDRPKFVARCGGVRLCQTCTIEAMPYVPAFAEVGKAILPNHGGEMDFIEQAKDVVYNYVREHLEKTDTHVSFGPNDVYVVWFSKTLRNWKALVSTTLPDGMYYEVTHNGDKGETYLDAYKKFHNVTVAC